MTPDKYQLYEAAVQSPEQQVDMLRLIYTDLRGRSPLSLREDFCGTFANSAAWLKSNPKAWALGLDLDPAPLAWGRARRGDLPRLKILQKNVLSITSPKVDVECACNFSFYTFKRRSELLKYFRAARASLKPQGVLCLEMSGGPGFIEEIEEKDQRQSLETGTFNYIWHQKSFDPLTRNGHYAIHFELKKGRRIHRTVKNAFKYDWRLWTIPEVRDALIDAGFRDTAVYWEKDRGDELTGTYERSERGSNYWAWICYVVGVK